MATRTWAGGTHNWSATAAWVEAVVPTAADDVVMNVNTTGTLTIDGTSGTPSLCRSWNATGFTGTVSMGGSAFINIGDASGGSMTLVSGMAFTPAAGATFNFISTTTGNTITTAGKALGVVNINGVGGGWTLQDNFTGVTSRAVTLTNGTFDTGGHNFNPDQFLSLTGGTRVLNLGSSNFTLGVGTNGTYTVGDLSTGLTINAGTSTITLPSNTGTITLGNQTYNALAGSVGGGAPSQTLVGDWTAASYTEAPNSAQALTILLAGNPTVTGAFTISGFGNGVRSFVRSSARGTQRTLSAGSVAADYTDWQDINGTGSSGWNLSAVTGGSGDGGGNSGITFTTPATIYAKTNSSQNSFANGYWFTSSGGSTPARMPLLQDTAIFDASSITAGSLTMTIAIRRIGAVNWTGVANSPTFSIGSNALEFYGPITLVSGMTISNSASITYAGRGTSALTTAGKTIANPLIIDSASGMLTLGDNLTDTSFHLQQSGTFSTNGHTSQFTTIEHQNGTMNVDATMTLTGGTNLLDGGTLNLTGPINATGAFTFSSGTLNLAAQLKTAAITLSGGASNITGNSAEYKGTTCSVTGGSHTIKKLTLSSTMAQSGSSVLTFPAGASATWATSWTNTGTTLTTNFGGVPTFLNGAMTVAATSPPNLEGS